MRPKTMEEAFYYATEIAKHANAICRLITECDSCPLQSGCCQDKGGNGAAWAIGKLAAYYEFYGDVSRVEFMRVLDQMPEEINGWWF